MSSVAWPRMRCRLNRSPPLSRYSLAKVCRKVCGWSVPRPARPWRRADAGRAESPPPSAAGRRGPGTHGRPRRRPAVPSAAQAVAEARLADGAQRHEPLPLAAHQQMRRTQRPRRRQQAIEERSLQATARRRREAPTTEESEPPPPKSEKTDRASRVREAPPALHAQSPATARGSRRDRRERRAREPLLPERS